MRCGKAVKRINLPHPETGTVSLTQGQIARWPHGCGLNIALGALGAGVRPGWLTTALPTSSATLVAPAPLARTSANYCFRAWLLRGCQLLCQVLWHWFCPISGMSQKSARVLRQVEAVPLDRAAALPRGSWVRGPQEPPLKPHSPRSLDPVGGLRAVAAGTRLAWRQGFLRQHGL